MSPRNLLYMSVGTPKWTRRSVYENEPTKQPCTNQPAN